MHKSERVGPAKLLAMGGKNVNEPIHSLLSFEFFIHNFSETIRCIGLKFSQITEIAVRV